jgi:TolB-like protein/Flp pilus assembly protein TadD
MELVDGVTLADKLRSGPMPVADVLTYARQIAGALQEAHAKGIVHRDVKAENVMIGRKNQVKVMDFGLARLQGALKLTRTSQTVGTLSYMAPELIHGAEATPHSDMYAFGVLFYQMLTGRLPFHGEHEAAVMYEILNGEPAPLARLRPDTPGDAQGLIARLLQKDPAKRPSSMEEVSHALSLNRDQPSARSPEKSIAVLYFENMSADQESDYFCAGMTEDIITDLSRIKELKVVPRGDVFPFRKKEVNTRQIGSMLQVNYILEGSIRKAGNRIRITAQLVDVQSGFQLWADRFDRLLEDIFNVQDEVSQKITSSLKVSLSASEQQSLLQKPTDNLRAYELLLRGRDLMYRRGRKNNDAAITMFQQALSLDPAFAAVYAALAEAYSYNFSWYDGGPQWLERTVEMTERATQLDPATAETQFGKGMVYFHKKQFADARKVWEGVIRQRPDFYDAHRWLGIISDIEGRFDEALEHYEHCARIKPYSEEPPMHAYMTYRKKGDERSALEMERRLIEVGERKLEINPDDAIALSRMAGPYAHLGQPEKARAALKRVTEIDPRDGLLLYNIACSYAVLGEVEEAVSLLRAAVRSGYKNTVSWIKFDPDLESVRAHPSYNDILAEVETPPTG